MTDPAREFDSYAGDYDAALEKGIAVSGESKEFFARERLRWLKTRLDEMAFRPARILDFGCGTGTATPFLRQTFSPEKIVGVDVSELSLDVARQDHGESADFHLLSSYAEDNAFDLAFCNGVFHHIPLDQRAGAAAYVARSLQPGGRFAMWENNPWSPGARIVMSRIPFDRDAIMLWPRTARNLLIEAGLQIERTDFQFVFPHALSALRVLEPPLCQLPLGAQYQVLARKPQ